MPDIMDLILYLHCITYPFYFYRFHVSVHSVLYMAIKLSAFNPCDKLFSPQVVLRVDLVVFVFTRRPTQVTLRSQETDRRIHFA